MKRLLILLLVILTSCGRVGDLPLKNGKESGSIAKYIGETTVALVLKREDGSVRAYCTGVWVANNMILTAHHCVQAVAEMENSDSDKVEGTLIHYILENEVMGIEAEPSAIHLGKVFKDDSKHDLALVKAVGTAIPEHRSAKLAEETAMVGERLHFCGHVGGLYWTYVEGVVSAYRTDLPIEMSGPFLQVSAPIYFGNSGGGAFNSRGELVGISSFLLRRIPNTAFYIHLDSIKKLLKE